MTYTGMNEKQDIIREFSEMPMFQEGIDMDYDDPKCLIEQYGFPTKDDCYAVAVNGRPKIIESTKALTVGLSLEEVHEVIDMYCNELVDMLETGTYRL